VVTSDGCGEARAATNDLIRYLGDDTIARARKTFARFDSEGQRGMAELHHGGREKLEVSPSLWAGVGLVRGGAATALVGDPATAPRQSKDPETDNPRRMSTPQLVFLIAPENRAMRSVNAVGSIVKLQFKESIYANHYDKRRNNHLLRTGERASPSCSVTDGR
jgi:hypothetical protein